MEATIDVDWTRLDNALSATLAESKREPIVVVREVAKGVVRKLVDITPPAHDGVRGIEARSCFGCGHGGLLAGQHQLVQRTLRT